MAYSVSRRVTFNAMEAASFGAAALLGLVIEDCKKELRAAGIGAYNAVLRIRPYFQSDTTRAIGLTLIMTADTSKAEG